MDLIYTNKAREDMGVLQDFDLDLAFGSDENNFECTIPAEKHCCESGSLLYLEGTEYGGMVDGIESNTEAKEVKYKGRTWHGILGSKVIEPLKSGEAREPVEPSRVPEGYTELEYIESTGTQYIDTGFKANQDTRVCVEAEVTEVPTSHSILFGGRTSGTSKSFTCWWYTASNGARFDYGAYDVDTKIILPSNTKLIVDANKGNCSYGSVYSETNTYGAFQCDYSLALFAVNTTGSASNFFKGKVYSCQIYNNGLLVRDFVPCCKDSDGEIGLYDVVNDQFYGNSGTGVFYGNVPRKLPDGYTQVEYIQSSGTQYIDTGYKVNNNTRVVMDHKAVSGTNPTMFGTWDSGIKNAFIYLIYTGLAKTGSFYGTTQIDLAIDCSGRHTIDANKTVFNLDDTTIATFGSATFAASYNLFLFAFSDRGTARNLATAYVYSCQIYDNGTLVRDYVPCRNASGVLGLYDLANDVFYKNAGSGSFTAGSDMEPPKEHGVKTTLTVAGVVNRYLVVSGDANECIQFILERINLADLFAAKAEAAGVNIEAYQFDRFTDAYSGLNKMLASAGLKLKTEAVAGKAVSFGEALMDYTMDEEFDSDLVDFVAIKTFRDVNHLICLGSGELEKRMVIHLYVDTHGNISQEQTQTGLDDFVAVFDYPNAESEEDLILNGTEELLKLMEPDKLKVDFDDTTDIYDVGDIVGAYDNITGISVAAVITKKIVTIKNGQITISYKVGE